MLQIGICDDQKQARFTLRYGLESLLERRGIEAELYEFSSGDRLLDWLHKHAGELDLVFLDIEMEGSNGMETAKQIRAMNQALQLVFVTGYSDFVFDGYSVGALGYIMKPPAPAHLEEVVTRTLTALHLNEDTVYLCKNSEGTYRIPKSSILYFSSDKRLVTCVTKLRSYSFYARLDMVAQEVGKDFVRIHQRYLVNSSAVEHIDGSSVHLAGQTLPISRALQKDAMMALTRAMLD